MYALSLADGGCLRLASADPSARRILDFWAEKAGLKPAVAAEAAFPRLLVVTGELRESPNSSRPDLFLPGSFSAEPGDIVCPLTPSSELKRIRRIDIVKARKIGAEAVAEPMKEEEWFWQQLVRISACVGRTVQPRGGVLIHSGLAAYLPEPDLEPRGFLLAGRSGVGKSTAGRRLPMPWISLADDITLIVRPSAGNYLAHPFPTWSRFFGQEKGDGSDTWETTRPVPLKAVFVLEQGEKDRIEPLGPGHALSLLVELAAQASSRLVSGFSLDQIMNFNQERFDNLCALVKSIPAYLLHVSLNGTFWEEIGRTLA